MLNRNIARQVVRAALHCAIAALRKSLWKIWPECTSCNAFPDDNEACYTFGKPFVFRLRRVSKLRNKSRSVTAAYVRSTNHTTQY